MYICCQSNLYYVILFILKYVNMLLFCKIIGPKEDYFNIIINKIVINVWHIKFTLHAVCQFKDNHIVSMLLSIFMNKFCKRVLITSWYFVQRLNINVCARYLVMGPHAYIFLFIHIYIWYFVINCELIVIVQHLLYLLMLTTFLCLMVQTSRNGMSTL